MPESRREDGKKKHIFIEIEKSYLRSFSRNKISQWQKKGKTHNSRQIERGVD